MPKRHLVMLLAGLACTQAAAQRAAQPAGALPQVTIQPGSDSVDDRRALRRLAVCAAEARPGWAREALAQPYLSREQATTAAEILRGRDTCMRVAETEINFRTSGVVGGLAEHFLRSNLDKIEGRRLQSGLNSVAPLNGSEDFALCVAARNPAAARALALSDPGSGAEAGAARQLAPAIAACLQPGERPEVEVPSLRALTAVALYRAATVGQRD